MLDLCHHCIVKPIYLSTLVCPSFNVGQFQGELWLQHFLGMFIDFNGTFISLFKVDYTLWRNISSSSLIRRGLYPPS